MDDSEHQEEEKDEVHSLPEEAQSAKSSKISELESEIQKEKEARLRLEKEIEEFKKITEQLLQAIN